MLGFVPKPVAKVAKTFGTRKNYGEEIFRPRAAYKPKSWIKAIYPLVKYIFQRRTGGGKLDDLFRARFCPHSFAVGEIDGKSTIAGSRPVFVLEVGRTTPPATLGPGQFPITACYSGDTMCFQLAKTRVLYSLWTVILCLFSTTGRAAEESDNGAEFFEKRIRPVLVTSCYKCHSESAKEIKGGLRLDLRAGLIGGGDSGAAIVPGDAGKSLLLQAIRYQDFKMPPKAKLPDAVIADFERWIKMGAPDPRTGTPPTESASYSPKDHWAFQPITKPAIPQTANASWPQNTIDQFIRASDEQPSVEPAGEVDANQMLRRLYFDLIGLPPSIKSIHEFEQSAIENRKLAIENVVDHLLASPRFGERWGRHWLDLVRFSESNGGDRNVIWPHAWRYRNWVIDALNDDKPYDEFIREQIAGDLMESRDSDQRDARLVATGMLTLGPKLFMETKAERFRMDRVDEQIDVISRSVLGLTVSCARCHDHKFDPIPTRDYYALAGIFRSTFSMYGQAAPAGNQYGHDRPLQPIGKDADKLQGPAEAHLKTVAEKTAERNKARSDRYRVVRKKTAQQNKLEMLKAKTPDAATEIKALTDEIATLDADIKVWDEKIKKLDDELKQLVDNPPPFPDYAMAVRDDENCEDCRIRIRGDYNRNGDLVPRGFLTAISSVDSKLVTTGSGRLVFANWITDSGNPLTARVAVNRVWQHLFGEGLVRSVNNFGVTGETPTNPQLLDHLATRFTDQGWSTKRLIREIVLSRTYQSQNAPRRLEAEPLRDAMLAVSGRLDVSRPSGSIVSTIDKPEFNATVFLTAEQLESRHRSVYLPIVRNWLPNMLATFDFADPSLVVGRRSSGTKHAQQLFLMNSPFVIEQAKIAADRMITDAESDEQRIELAYRRFFARSPNSIESKQAAEFLAQIDKQVVAIPDQTQQQYAWTRFCHALFASAEFRMIE